MADPIIIIAGETFTAVHIVIFTILLAAAIFGILKWKSHAKKTESFQKMIAEMDHDKAMLYDRSESLEKENREMREKLEKMEREYSEKMKEIQEKETRMAESSEKLDEGLLKIKAMKDTIEMHRLKIGELEKENLDIKKELDRVKEEYERELSLTKNKFQSRADELKIKTKEAVAKFTEEKDRTISALKSENEELKQKVVKLKEKLGLWESVGDL